MPMCPYCHKPVTSAFTVWCSCGTNLSSYPNLPNDINELKTWLEKNNPDALSAEIFEGNLLEQARKSLITEQEKEIEKASQKAYEVARIKRAFADFLEGCSKEGLSPNVDVGRLRKERFKEQKKTKQTYNMPQKNFRLTPSFHFQIFFSRSVEDFYLTEDGELYRHHMNAPDPFPMEELLKMTTVEKVVEGLRKALVGSLRQRQHQATEAEPQESQ